MAGSSVPASRRWFWRRSWFCAPARPRARPRTRRCRRYTLRRRRKARSPPAATRIPECRAGAARSRRPGNRGGSAVMASVSTMSAGRPRVHRPTTRGPPSSAAPTAATRPDTDPVGSRPVHAGAVNAFTHSPDARTHDGIHVPAATARSMPSAGAVQHHRGQSMTFHRRNIRSACSCISAPALLGFHLASTRSLRHSLGCIEACVAGHGTDRSADDHDERT